jgi:DNA-binding MarR family transcriptional regulator
MNTLNSTDTSELSKMRLRAWLKILKTSSLIEKSLRERLRDEFDTTLPRFDVMSALSRSDKGLKMSQLSAVLKVSNGNVTGIVDRLVDGGHVVRIAVQGDRRANLVCLTSKGREQFTIYAEAHEAWLNEMLIDLSSDNAQTLIDLLSVVSDSEKDA